MARSNSDYMTTCIVQPVCGRLYCEHCCRITIHSQLRVTQVRFNCLLLFHCNSIAFRIFLNTRRVFPKNTNKFFVCHWSVYDWMGPRILSKYLSMKRERKQNRHANHNKTKINPPNAIFLAYHFQTIQFAVRVPNVWFWMFVCVCGFVCDREQICNHSK